MATANRWYRLHGRYFLPIQDGSDSILHPVGLADILVWPEAFLKESQEFYVEIRLDGTKVQATQAVCGGRLLSWDEEVLMYVPTQTVGCR
jgi:hypothetical protein